MHTSSRMIDIPLHYVRVMCALAVEQELDVHVQ